MPPDYGNLDRSSRAILPTLTEVTFRPHSADYCSFTAVIYTEQGVSFGQLSRLIASIGHVGKINDFTIKPIEQHSFLVTGFSRYTPSRLSFSGKAISTTAEAGRTHKDATRTRPQHGKAMHAQPLASQGSEPSSSNNDSDLSDSDPDISSDDDGYSSEARSRRFEHEDKYPMGSYRRAALGGMEEGGQALGAGSSKSSQAGLMPQYARAGAWSVPEASRLPPTGGQRVAQALCAYLPLGICWDEYLIRTLSFCRPVPTWE